MSKKGIKMHQKGMAGGLYQAHRMEGSTKNFGNKAIRKAKKSNKS